MNFYDILLAKKLEDKRDPQVKGLTVTDNGTYSEANTVYNVVNVNVPIDEKAITENGEYYATDDELKGYSKVTVNIAGYKTKAMPTGSTASFNDGQALPLTKLKVGIDSVQAGSGDPSPTNIRQISGWSVCNINDTGTNVWDEEWEVGTINVNTGAEVEDNTRIRNKGYIPIKENTTYHFTVPANDGRIVFYKADKTFLSALSGSTIFTNKEFTSPNGAYYVRFSPVASYGTTYNNDISINYPSTDTSYHAYNGTTYNIDFVDGSTPLTVYGGTLDVTNGALTVDKVMVDLGTLNWNYSTTNEVFYTDINIKVNPMTTMSACICSKYKPAIIGYPANMNNETIMQSSEIGRIYIKDTNYTDAPTFKIAVDGVQLVYELETPETYQLTPTQINTLLGANNIWSDTGDIIEGEYFTSL